MSEHIQNPEFDQPSPEYATPEDIAAMERATQDLIDSERYQIRREYQYALPNGPIASFDHVAVFIDGEQEYFTGIAISDPLTEEVYIRFEFNSEHELCDVGYTADDGPESAISAIDAFIETGMLPKQDELVMTQVKRMCQVITGGEKAVAFYGVVPISDENRVPIGQIITKQVGEYADIVTHERQATVVFPPSRRQMVMAYEQLITGQTFDAKEMDEVPVLQVRLDDANEQQQYIYSRYIDGTYGLEVLDIADAPFSGSFEAHMLIDDENQDMFGEDSPKAEQISALYQLFYDDQPLKSHVHKLTQALQEGIAIKTHKELAASEVTYTYPELPFGIDFTHVFKIAGDDHESFIRFGVAECLRSLHVTTETVLPDIIEEEQTLPLQPNYQPSPLKSRRIHNFLHQPVQVMVGDEPKKQTRIKHLDVQQATTQVLDEIFEQENHPVAQLAAILQTEHASYVGKSNLDHIISEVVMTTHWPRVREILIGQLAGRQLVRASKARPRFSTTSA